MSMTEDNIIQRPLEEVLPESFLGYSKHVILQRAVPDVRDGLKPVHRRILYSMDEIGMYTDKPYSKSARLVGDCMGKYHPHGDSSIYEAAVRMAQPWATRYPMVDGQGNFGSIDGDNAAAMRYTEMRMTHLSQLMTQDIEKNTVLFKENYDQRLKEPVVLPSPFPNLLVNGGSGIAVGMMSNIPPHNLREVIAGVIQQIDDPEVSLEELMEKVSGPDFPTGGLIIGSEGITSAYKTGRGKVTMRGKAAIEPGKNGKSQILITEIPYQVNKSTLAAKIGSLSDSGKIEGISDVRDESDREGIRLVVECRKDADPLLVLRLLYKHTQLEDTFGIINLVITANGTPKVLGLKEINAAFIEHRRIVVTKRTEFDLEKARLRAHILEGLVIAINNLDEVIALIRGSKNPSLAKAALMTRFELSEIQAQAILDMKLQNLTNFELDSIKADHAEVLKLIAHYESILADVNKVYEIIKKELKEIGDKFGDDRRTLILPEEMREQVDLSSLEEPESPIQVLLTAQGFIKRTDLPTRGRKDAGLVCSFKDGDTLDLRLNCSNRDTLYFFSRSGKFYTIKAKTVLEGKNKDKGGPLTNLFPLSPEDKVVSILPLRDNSEDLCFVFVTKEGQVMRSPVSDFAHARSSEAMGLKGDDTVVKVFLSDGEGELFLAAQNGQGIRFAEAEINPMGRKSRGVKGMTLGNGDGIADALLIAKEEESSRDLVMVTQRGFLKRTSLDDYRPQGRAGKGIAMGKVDLIGTGYVVGIAAVQEDDSLNIIQENGTATKVEIKDVKTELRTKAGSQWVPVLLNDYVVRIV
ncbi:DNA gyrase, A subunit [Desulfosporosinus orientis DSM 765]|uniref:DNA topoisomerase (ATP-hydrolyzing) n=1 Tax=Desulfosporosinus orientis (strain ATCC 19365 / DSM 765 / NCIMB 8382 / VKM B-1628 / Singapore I) TaxID=768706 RepID=G7WB21_DESOD|nr:DNA gyrase subunit A [Desulfosporosinus orientis]AET67522.1 DNA gyrase, A subunit [Desulfosporosinus orientis DSM 765]